ncbi:hypothetical protein C6P40_000393 [Pichia californica]|uniref:Uncharacterized protein n=1 Tax=Pichia californica TaxID=460514 RepID=A0A9P7BGL3_9ASCO|nr:hypothetical protein C6P40_000393 [[Candida] californica]
MDETNYKYMGRNSIVILSRILDEIDIMTSVHEVYAKVYQLILIITMLEISQSIEITQNKVDEGLMMDDIVEKSYRMI